MKQLKNKEASRRGFLQNTAKLAGASIIMSSLPESASAYVVAAGDIKVALVGCGGRGTGAAAQALTADKDVKLVAMADVFRDQLDRSFKTITENFEGGENIKVSEETKFVGFDSYKKAIDLADVVIIATPPGFRPLHFEYAVNQGKHIFAEKPLATDVVGVKRILESAKIAKQKKLNVVVGLQRHYQKNYREVYKLLQKGKVGDLVSGQVYWNSEGVWVRPRKYQQTELEYQMRNWYYFTWLCGDHILEQHIHNIDVANWFIGSAPVSAQGMGGRETRKGKDHGHIFDHHFVEFIYPEGQVISSQCRHQKGCMTRVEEVFQGTKGNIRVHAGNYGKITSRDGSSIYDHEGKNDINPYQQEHNELFAAIKAGEYKFADTESGAKSTMTAILGRMATYSGQQITWDEAMATDLKLVGDLNSFDDPAPIQPDANGNYPVAVPGETKFLAGL
ncbi:MAG: Gfo/Idh/MocA family oxidoreductase [Bacteroidetes bacterium]|nr:Gfo/Idh/MocA family oxidoreductase [Bacteroidota bacterium]MDA1122537.1 Gfo/Idh/MocA family oxidoreductase [Bacteroidota bacterium]